MQRWNGWGDDSVTYPLPPAALSFLAAAVGPATPPQDATLEHVIALLPASRLPQHPLVAVEPETRLRHARGHSLPDWIALRSGHIAAFPDGVAHPSDGGQVRDLLRYAGQVGARLIPYGGGTSVVGHINPAPGDAPVLTMNMSRLNQLRAFDAASLLASLGAGISGPDLEAQLRARGATLGHFPQSFELSTLGGWVASRSSGQQSFHYGRIEDMFAGGRVETPAGPLRLPPHPASAAGPACASSSWVPRGALASSPRPRCASAPCPNTRPFTPPFSPHWESGHSAVREIAQARVPASMLRLSNAVETQTTLILAGHERLVGLAQRALGALRLGDEKCLLLFGVTGQKKLAQRARRDVISIVRAHKGLHVGQYMGHKWRESRFHSAYLRNTLWELGYAVDTLETALPWSAVPETVQAVQAELRAGLQDVGERVHAFAHLSHIYPHGASFYITYLFRLALAGARVDPDVNLRRWQTLKKAASQVIVSAGGTISHQHGVGTDHLAYMQAEKGALGLAVLEAARQTFDPQGLMNPGKLLEE